MFVGLGMTALPPVLPLVSIKPPATLFPQPTRLHHQPQPHAWSILRIPQLAVQHLHDTQTSIQADEIGQLQRTHGHIRPVLHNRVDVFFFSHTGFETNDGFVDVGHQNAVGEETGGVGGEGGDFAHAFAEFEGGGEGLRRGLEAGDDFDAFLDGDGVHEVRADYATGGGEIGGVGRSCSGYLRDRDGGCVGRENGVWGTSLRQLCEDALFQVDDLGHGFDDHVYVAKIIHPCARRQAFASGVRVRLGELLFGDVLC